LSSQTLSRFLDYNLDPFNGSLYFKQPIPSRDSEFNLIYIVAEYETTAGESGDVVAGGRMAVRNSSRAIELGVTHINDGQQGAEADLTGVDLRWQANDATLISAEIAQSNNDSGGTSTTGSAQLLSIEHRSDKLDLRARYQKIEQAFGLNQQSAAQKGIQKFAIDGRYQYSHEVFLTCGRYSRRISKPGPKDWRQKRAWNTKAIIRAPHWASCMHRMILLMVIPVPVMLFAVA
jgi:hypothetical protein